MTLPPRDLRASMNSGIAAVPGTIGRRHTRSSSKGTASNDVLGVTYDLEVFRDTAVNENVDLSRSPTSLHVNSGDSSDVSATESVYQPGHTQAGAYAGNPNDSVRTRHTQKFTQLISTSRIPA